MEYNIDVINVVNFLFWWNNCYLSVNSHTISFYSPEDFNEMILVLMPGIYYLGQIKSN